MTLVICVLATTQLWAKNVLIYGPSMDSFTPNEQSLATAAGHTVTVVDAATWSSMTTAQFAAFDAIVFGDPDCTTDTSLLATASATQSVWGPAVTGQKIIIGTDPIFHFLEGIPGAGQLITSGINFAASGPGTGLYVSLSCYFAGASSPTPVDFLSFLGSFQMLGQDGCPDSVSIVDPTNPAMAGLTSDALSNWSCSMHEWFSSFPSSFTQVAVETSGSPASRPYIIAQQGCTTNVTRESQGDPRWAANLYDHSRTVTIQQQGCALTSLSMALNNAGVSNNPGSLNTFMAATDTDFSGLGVNWGPATRDASGRTLKFHAQRIDSTVDLQGAKQYLDTNVCQLHHPVIVGVDLDANGTPGHFVLVTGKKGDDFQIADPGFARTALSQYDNEFVTRGFVADPPGDLSELDLAAGDVAETVVTDPLGRETGFDPNLQKIVEQIPASAYFRDSLQDDVSGAPATEINHLTEIFQPTQGTYEIVVNGLKLGTYALSVRMFSQDGSAQPDLLIPGIAGPGSSSSFSIQLTSAPGSTSTVTVAATISSALADINNSLQLGLIDNHGIANSLSQKLAAAQGAAPDTRNNIVNAFINEVNAQSGKHITGVAVQVLLADANSLLIH